MRGVSGRKEGMVVHEEGYITGSLKCSVAGFLCVGSSATAQHRCIVMTYIDAPELVLDGVQYDIRHGVHCICRWMIVCQYSARSSVTPYASSLEVLRNAHRSSRAVWCVSSMTGPLLLMYMYIYTQKYHGKR